MAGRTTDRKHKSKQTFVQSKELRATGFALPSSLTCSEVEFPVLIKKTRRANWKQILKESDEKINEIEEYVQSKEEPKPFIRSPFQNTECDYMQNEVFIHLMPALIDTLTKAKLWKVLEKQRSFYNGIDNIVQILWNNNPRHPWRKENNLHLFNMPWVREYLKTHPRPLYPKSWLWTEDYAATVIQKTIRQYIVQKDEEVQEMRDFWKKLNLERQCPEINTNPLLAKKLASMAHFNMKNRNSNEKK